MISIHALREERDSQDFRGILHYRNFNPRAPRGARPAHTIKGRISKYFNPRAPRGARHRLMLEIAIITGISIHALREERDRGFGKVCSAAVYFNPRAPRGARQQKNTKQKSVLCDKHRIL